ncbi:hypothetical protein DPMN_184531 [Dreissena polymorpha]|uniref:Uncharacterized protein n=1 Tax=Dreissena polymorpha TaxID=45954 RepID=A0A9D4DK93_DREPO|nr:hypothetical protein DPMN_184531 [Dreissena polymorpha]
MRKPCYGKTLLWENLNIGNPPYDKISPWEKTSLWENIAMVNLTIGKPCYGKTSLWETSPLENFAMGKPRYGLIRNNTSGLYGIVSFKRSLLYNKSTT